jgi:3'(2'), 5'-bisphosphate nucleotidase
MDELLKKVVEIAQKAGDKIMEIYESRDFGVETKSDESPLTKADLAANEIITIELKKISDLDIVSEEGNHETSNDKFWLVDPLDGTKEFIKRNGEFTVNIALIEQGKPVLGVVYAPAKKLLYYGSERAGAFKIENNEKVQIKSIYRGEVPTLVVSRSHRDERINELLNIVGDHKEISMGSSLKLCLIAEGKAQIYPRLAPTCLWDTAAADAIVRIAGGTVVDIEGKLLAYEPQNNIKNPFFITVTQNTKDLEKYLEHLS